MLRSVTLPVLSAFGASPDPHGERYTLHPTKIIALGLNYRDHIAESLSVKVRGFGSDEPAEPVLFPKTTNVLVGPGEAIILPRIVDEYAFDEPRTDYEAELAVIMGRTGKNIPPQRVAEHVFGFTAMNDVSQRNIQNGDRSGWYRGKSFDTFGPIGPAILRTGDAPEPLELDVVCRLNGTEVQRGNTAQMIFGVAETVSFISRNFTLVEGDIILTGTPSGVGPMKDGDQVSVEIQGIGVLTNPVRREV